MKSTTPVSRRARHWHMAAAAAALTLLALAVYWPSLTGGFIWDDEELVTHNVLVKAADGLYRIWCTREPLDYWPVTNSSFWLEWRVWGANPVGYHVTNLLLHVGNALLAWAILRRLLIPGAFLAALIFLVHPVNVESVAWIAQRKNTLSMFFFLLSALCYLRPERRSDTRERPRLGAGAWYGLSLLAFTLAMLSKGSVVVLPVVLLLVVWWQRDRIAVSDVVRTAPFFLVGIAFTLVNIWFQTHGQETIRHATVIERLLGAGTTVWFYLYKALLPIHLSFNYPLWRIQAAELRWWLPLAAAVIVTVCLVWQRRSTLGRPSLFAWIFFGLALVPVMGFADIYFMKYSLVSDHYQYIALLGVSAAVAAAATRLAARWLPGAAVAWTAAALLIVAPLGALSWRESRQYVDAESLYRSTIERNPSSWLAHLNLGTLLQSGGRLDEATAQYRAALAINPDSEEAHRDLGLALETMGRYDDAVAELRQALRINPYVPEAHLGLGVCWQNLGRLDDASAEFREALRLKPGYAGAHLSLGATLEAQGHLPEAVEEFGESVRHDPRVADAHYRLANALMRLGRRDEAIAEYGQAIGLDRSTAEYHNNLAFALEQGGRLDEALAQYAEALRLRPDSAKIENNLGAVLLHLKRFDEAADHFRRALQLDPGYALARENLARAMAGRIQGGLCEN